MGVEHIYLSEFGRKSLQKWRFLECGDAQDLQNLPSEDRPSAVHDRVSLGLGGPKDGRTAIAISNRLKALDAFGP